MLLKLSTIFWIFVREEINRGRDSVTRGEIHRSGCNLSVSKLHLDLDLVFPSSPGVDVQSQGPAQLDVGVRYEFQICAFVLRAEYVEEDAGLVLVCWTVRSKDEKVSES